MLKCTVMWDCKFPFVVKPRPQVLQMNGFSPVWTLRWVCNFQLVGKLLLQNSQGYFQLLATVLVSAFIPVEQNEIN